MRAHPPGIGLGLYRARPTSDLLEAALNLGVRHLDSAFSYHHFSGHRDLAVAARDLLPEFTIATKVGFFPGGRHSLDPRELIEAISRCCDDLGAPPDLVMLHNPEQTLRDTGPAASREALAEGCATLARAAAVGLCHGWGISCWDAIALLPAAVSLDWQVAPYVLMTRAGLTVSARQLCASRVLIQSLRPRAVWGMSPFGGAPRDPIWTAIDARQFLREGRHLDSHQAAFRVACELPPVDLVVVGTSDCRHLQQLASVTSLSVDEVALGRYVALLDARASTAAAGDGLPAERDQ